jgi:hypothetical protein
MLALFFAIMFGVMFIGDCFDAGHVRWDKLFLPGGIFALLLWFAIARKTVQIDDRFLYVSVFRRAVAIPLDQIETVKESIGMNANARSVTVHFRNKTPFGRSIKFSPTLMLTREEHPIVAELLAIAHKHEQLGNG